VPFDELLGDLTSRLASSPRTVALFVDFDGTLSPIVAEPADARPLPQAVDALTRLARRCGVVAVVSGRPLTFLARWFPPEVRLAGLYGLEQRIGGALRRDPDAQPWSAVVADTVSRARSELPADVLVEDKGLSLTLHFRTSPHRADLVRSWAETTGVTSGLQPRPAKMSMELHPPIHRDKGRVISEWAAGAEVVLFAGDDAGDLPAYATLQRLAANGTATWGVVVAASETPADVLAAADLALNGPEELADVLVQLAAAAN
jgi:trehalose 6-phosphate phosphatase